MGTKAYFMVKLVEKFNEDRYYLDAVRELEAVSEVEEVMPVSGAYDLLVKVDAPIRVVTVANKIQAMKWVKNFHVLKVEPAAPVEAPKPAERELLGA